MSESDDGTSWVSVGEAAERSGLSTATIRQLYRSGAVPSRRRDGEAGPYLVDLAAVLSHVPEPSEEMEAAYWEDEARRARAEAAALRAELERTRAERDELQREVEDLRDPVYRGPIRERLPRRPSTPVEDEPRAGAEAEPEPEVEPTPTPAPTFGDGQQDRRKTPRPAAGDVVVPVDEQPRKGLLRRRRS